MHGNLGLLLNLWAIGTSLVGPFMPHRSLGVLRTAPPPPAIESEIGIAIDPSQLRGESIPIPISIPILRGV